MHHVLTCATMTPDVHHVCFVRPETADMPPGFVGCTTVNLLLLPSELERTSWHCLSTFPSSEAILQALEGLSRLQLPPLSAATTSIIGLAGVLM